MKGMWIPCKGFEGPKGVLTPEFEKYYIESQNSIDQSSHSANDNAVRISSKLITKKINELVCYTLIGDKGM